MKSYAGIRNDTSYRGGEFIRRHGWGHELFNFAAKNGKCYGNKSGGKRIDISRLGASEENDAIKNITVVWTATNHNGGTYIIGWYKKATVFRESQTQPRTFRGERLVYFVECKEQDAILLPEDERVFEIPRGLNGMGQGNVWYAEHNPKVIKSVRDYIFRGIIPSARRIPKGRSFQVDSIKRKKVENAAILHIHNYYSRLGYEIKSVEMEKIGWDLEATRGKSKLLLEVKGLSGREINIELTHNEYSQLQVYKSNFRLCIVTNVLEKPSRYIFSYSESERIWNDVQQDKKLNFYDITSARVTA